MGCCKSKDKVQQPQKKTTQQRRTETDADLNLDNDVRKNVEIKSSIEASNIQKEVRKERELKAAVNQAKKVEKEREEKPKQPMVQKVEEKKPEITKEEHAKLVVLADKWYRGIEALLSYLKENLMHNKQETEDLEEIVDELVGYNKDLEKRLPDLKTRPFANDKQKLKDYTKASLFIKELEAEYFHYKKKTKNYPEFRDIILALLGEDYPELFDESEQPELQKSIQEAQKAMSERSFAERSMRSARGTSMREIANEEEVPKARNQYDQAFDKEMAIVMQRERDQAAFELEQQVNEYNRLMEDMNRMKNRQQNLGANYDSTRKEARDLRLANNNLVYTNETLQVENQTFKEIQQDMVDANLQAKESVLQLEQELYDVHRKHQQNYIDFQNAGQDYEYQVRELERVAADRRKEANELERRYQEDLRRLFNKEDEIQYQKARIIEQVDLNYDLRENIVAYGSGSLHENIEATRKSYRSTAGKNTQPSPRKSVLKPPHQDENLQDTISALAEAKRARVENDNNWTGTGLELKRAELYGGGEGVGSRMSTLSGSYGVQKYGFDQGYDFPNKYSNAGYVERSSYKQSYGYGNRI